MSYEIDYNDERFAKVEADKQEALNEVELLDEIVARLGCIYTEDDE